MRPANPAPAYKGDDAVHVLIIEDEFLVALMIGDHLQELGYDTSDIACSASEAISFAHERTPDLIIADYRLTAGNGVEAVQAICRLEAIPVIFVTGNADEVRQRLPKAFVLGKPIHSGALNRTLPLARNAPYLNHC